jgi:hypothetical protein
MPRDRKEPEALAVPVGQRLGVKALHAQFIEQQTPAERGDREVNFDVSGDEQFDGALRVQRAASAGDAEDNGKRHDALTIGRSWWHGHSARAKIVNGLKARSTSNWIITSRPGETPGPPCATLLSRHGRAAHRTC